MEQNLQRKSEGTQQNLRHKTTGRNKIYRESLGMEQNLHHKAA